MFAALCLLFCSLAAAGARELYVGGSQRRVQVSDAYRGLGSMYGLARGYYQSKGGLFLSTFREPAIYFLDTSVPGCERANTCTLTKLVGTGYSGITDGVFVGQAGVQGSLCDPSRMVYVALGSNHWLFVTDRANGLIRVLDLDAKTISTLRMGGAALMVSASQLPDNNPELDIRYHNNYLYVSDSSNVYNISGRDHTLLSAVLTDAVMTRYGALKQWQLANDYDKSTRKVYLTSIEIDPSRGMLFASYSYMRNAIVRFPLGLHSPAQVEVLSSDGVLWNPATSVPYPSINGSLLVPPPAGFAHVTFPMNMAYDAASDQLLWSEVFAHFSSGTVLGALGAVAVRRVQLATGEVDYFAGNRGTFRYIYGKTTGYVNGWADEAQFSYPVTMALVGGAASSGGGVLLYVVDSQNAAVRKVEQVYDTPQPSMSPTLTIAPSAPTARPSSGPPSIAPTCSPSSLYPTAKPSLSPSISMAPTKFSPPTSQPSQLVGECLIFTMMDLFGDGWSGSQLRIEAPGHSPEVTLHEPTDASPQQVRICSSYLRPDQFGFLAASVVSPSRGNYANLFEIKWRVLIEMTGQEFTGHADTSMVFSFDESGFSFVDSANMETTSRAVSCERCRHPKPKPKVVPIRGPVWGNSSESESSHDGQHDSDNSSKNESSHGSQSESGSSAESRPHAARPSHELTVVLHDAARNGWFDASGEGTRFYITDSFRHDLLASGTLCGEDLLKDDCAADLPDGDYYFRVDGALSASRDDVSWTFCRQHGVAMQELSFSVVDGECVPGALRDAAAILGGPTSTMVSLAGHVLLTNVFASTFSFTDGIAVEEAIHRALSQVDNSSTLEVMVSSSCGSKDGKFCSNDDGAAAEGRALPEVPKGTSAWDLSVLVTLIAEKNGVDGTRRSRVDRLSEKVRRTMTRAVLEGVVQEAIQTYAEASSIASLRWAHVHRELPLQVVHVNYISTAPPTTAPSAATDLLGVMTNLQVVEVVDESGLQILLVLLMVGMPALGLVAFATRDRWGAKAADGALAVTAGEVQRGSWQQAVLKPTEAAPSRHSLASPPHVSPEGRVGSVSVDDLLAIPGRSAPKTPTPAAADVTADRRSVTSDRQKAIPSRPLVGTANRYRVREGLGHHDLSSTIRSGLDEGNVVL